jgi:hypothetical protein
MASKERKEIREREGERPPEGSIAGEGFVRM